MISAMMLGAHTTVVGSVILTKYDKHYQIGWCVFRDPTNPKEKNDRPSILISCAIIRVKNSYLAVFQSTASTKPS